MWILFIYLLIYTCYVQNHPFGHYVIMLDVIIGHVFCENLLLYLNGW